MRRGAVRGGWSTRLRCQDGIALVEFVWLTALLLLPLIWLVLSVFEVQRGAFSISTAARAAGRAFVLAPDERTAHARAQAAARASLADQGVHGPVSVQVSCSLGRGRCLDGTSVVTVQVHTEVALPLIPRILGQQTASVGVDGRHVVPVGRYVAGRR